MCICAGQGTLPEPKVRQLFKMAKDCLERGEDIFATARKEQRPLALFRLATPSPTASPTLRSPPLLPSNSSTSRSSSNFYPSQTLPSISSLNSSPSQRTSNTLPASNLVGASEAPSNHSRLMSWPASQVSNVNICHTVSKTQGLSDTERSQSLRRSQPGCDGRTGEGHGVRLQNNMSHSQPRYVPTCICVSPCCAHTPHLHPV